MLLQCSETESRAEVAPSRSGKLDTTPCSSIKVHGIEPKGPLVARYVRQPDGSLWLARSAGFEDGKKQPLSPSTKQQTSAEERSPGLAVGIFWKALGRRELIRNLLNIELLIDVLLGAVGLIEIFANPDLKPSVKARFWWLPIIWLCSAGVHFLLGLVTVSKARHEMYGLLVVTTVSSILMQFATVLMTSASGLPEDVPPESLAAALIPITAFTALPMRMAVSVHAWLMRKELRYLNQVPIDMLQELS